MKPGYEFAVNNKLECGVPITSNFSAMYPAMSTFPCHLWVPIHANTTAWLYPKIQHIVQSDSGKIIRWFYNGWYFIEFVMIKL